MIVTYYYSFVFRFELKEEDVERNTVSNTKTTVTYNDRGAPRFSPQFFYVRDLYFVYRNAAAMPTEKCVKSQPPRSRSNQYLGDRFGWPAFHEVFTEFPATKISYKSTYDSPVFGKFRNPDF